MDPATAFAQVTGQITAQATPQSKDPTPSTASRLLLHRENPEYWNVYFGRVLEYPEWSASSSNPKPKIALAPTKSDVIFKSKIVNDGFQCTICNKSAFKISDDLVTHMKQCTPDKKC